MNDASPWRRAARLLALAWGVGGVALLLLQAVIRLTPRAVEPLVDGSAGPVHLGLYLLSVLFNGYAEGYRAFQKQFSPRVVVRAFWLAEHPRPVLLLVAPLFCMGHLHATRRRLILAWGVSLGVVGLILIVRHLPQPWRGIVDAGVVVGLLWGLVTLLVFFLRALAGALPAVPTDLPVPPRTLGAPSVPAP